MREKSKSDEVFVKKHLISILFYVKIVSLKSEIYQNLIKNAFLHNGLNFYNYQ